MTMAVCIRCGDEKFGAWTQCPSCGFFPEEKEEAVKSVILTDHYFSHDELDRLAGIVKAGGEVEYPQHLFDEWMEQDLEKVTTESQASWLGAPIGCMLFFAIPALIGLVAIIWLIVALVNYFSM